MNDFFISFQAFQKTNCVGVGGIVVVCSCCLGRIRKAILDFNNSNCEEKYKADTIIITSLTILDPLTAVQLTDNYTNDVLRIEDEGNSAEEQ